MKGQNFDHSDEFASVEEVLSENRPELSGMQLDRVKQRARAQARRRTDVIGWKGIRIMKPRLVATSLLVAGMFFTGSGATLAVISDSQSAGKVQYPDSTTPTETTTAPQAGQEPDDGQAVLGEQFSGEEPRDAPDDTAVLGEREAGGDGAAPAADQAPADVQATRQLETSGGGELPFTGFAAIPVLVAGVLMLTTGIALRRTTRRDS